MRSNLIELFNEALPEHENNGTVIVEDLISDIQAGLVFGETPELRDFIHDYLYARVTTLLNQKDYYSYEKGKYISFDKASADNLEKIIKRYETDIGRRQASLRRFKKRKADIEGQLTFTFDGALLTGYQEKIV